jgi:teichuronic acid biosynthesis glycosyltransferase TuaC
VTGDKYRVLSLATLYPNAAAPRFGTFVARSMEALAARGDWDVTLINPIGVPPVRFGRYRQLAQIAKSATEHGIAVHRPVFTLIPKFGGRFNPGLIARAVLPLAKKLHRETPFDLIDAQFFYPDGPAAAQIAAALKLPLSIKARGADISYWGAKPYGLRQMVRAAGQASGLLAVSQALAADMAAVGLPDDKIRIHYTGLDRARFHPRNRQEARRDIRADLGITFPSQAPLLATIGALIPRKGQGLVIQALRELPDAHLLLVGTGPDETQLRALVNSHAMTGRVHFLGSLDHDALPVLLSAANAMVMPSASEGLANAWVEALACGTPLVISDAGGARELLRNASAGRIVERNAPSIAEGLRAVLTNPVSPEEVAANAAAFSWEENAADLASYYASLIAT